MGTIVKHYSTKLYTDPVGHTSHRVRMVLAEKDISVDTIDTNPKNLPEEVAGNSLPMLDDREVQLNESRVIMEYLDERYPHPPLLPVYPVTRAVCRLQMHILDRDWSPHVDRLMRRGGRQRDRERAHKELLDSLITADPLFADKPYFMSDEFTLMDCCVTPVLWRVKAMGIELPPRKTRGIHAYMKRLFYRESFQISLTEAELEMNI